uniref:Uncharacterized protein n=1 Tax=Physcomitrium patens TaxID=3218 RepID=A0A2K1IUB8_PHYPA|nr:hypothetical protein PHYPA_024813 [Physcomitrium patens]
MCSRAWSQTHIIYGEAKIEDLSSQLQKQAAWQFKGPEMANLESKAELCFAIETEGDDDVDEAGVEPKDIELVMTQAGVSRAKGCPGPSGSIRRYCSCHYGPYRLRVGLLK